MNLLKRAAGQKRRGKNQMNTRDLAREKKMADYTCEQLRNNIYSIHEYECNDSVCFLCIGNECIYIYKLVVNVYIRMYIHNLYKYTVDLPHLTVWSLHDIISGCRYFLYATSIRSEQANVSFNGKGVLKYRFSPK